MCAAQAGRTALPGAWAWAGAWRVPRSAGGWAPAFAWKHSQRPPCCSRTGLVPGPAPRPERPAQGAGSWPCSLFRELMRTDPCVGPRWQMEPFRRRWKELQGRREPWGKERGSVIPGGRCGGHSCHRRLVKVTVFGVQGKQGGWASSCAARRLAGLVLSSLGHQACGHVTHFYGKHGSPNRPGQQTLFPITQRKVTCWRLRGGGNLPRARGVAQGLSDTRSLCDTLRASRHRRAGRARNAVSELVHAEPQRMLALVSLPRRGGRGPGLRPVCCLGPFRS